MSRAMATPSIHTFPVLLLGSDPSACGPLLGDPFRCRSLPAPHRTLGMTRNASNSAHGVTQSLHHVAAPRLTCRAGTSRGTSGDSGHQHAIWPAGPRRAARVVYEIKGDDPMRPVTILVPNNICWDRRPPLPRVPDSKAAQRGRRNLHQHTHGWPSRSQARPCTLVAQRPARSRRPPGGQPWTRPPGASRVKDHPATVRALANAHRELRDVVAEARDRPQGLDPLSPDLLRLHESVTSRLAEGWYDATDSCLPQPSS